MKYRFLLGFFLFCGIQSIIAQPSADKSSTLSITLEANEAASDEDWAIFQDTEKPLLYIDFSVLKYNLNDIAVRNDKGEVLFREDVWDLPVDAIYEVDLTSYPSGSYDVELRSYKGAFVQKVKVP